MKAVLFAIIAAAVVFSGCSALTESGKVAPTQAPSQQVPPAQNQPQPAGCTFSGTWSTDWGTMVLVQSGSEVSGNYTFDEGRINGTVSGKTLSGWWSENAGSNAYMPPDNAGNVEFNLSEDCNSLQGAWRYGSEGDMSRGWNGERE